MGALHASVFFYKPFIETVNYYIPQIENHQFNTFRDDVIKAINSFTNQWPQKNLGEAKFINGEWVDQNTQIWPLYPHGSILPSEEKIKSTTDPSMRDIGEWLMVLLAQYLKSCSSPLGNWTVLSTVLKAIGWQQDDYKELFHGFPTYKLIKQNEIYRDYWPIKAEDPYWFWLHADRSRSGWLPNEAVKIFYNRLIADKEKIFDFNFQEFPGISTDNPVVIRDYPSYLLNGYKDTVSMTREAIENEAGLFMSVILYS
jgi:hypothetical protein